MDAGRLERFPRVPPSREQRRAGASHPQHLAGRGQEGGVRGGNLGDERPRRGPTTHRRVCGPIPPASGRAFLGEGSLRSLAIHDSRPRGGEPTHASDGRSERAAAGGWGTGVVASGWVRDEREAAAVDDRACACRRRPPRGAEAVWRLTSEPEPDRSLRWGVVVVRVATSRRTQVGGLASWASFAGFVRTCWPSRRRVPTSIYCF